MHTSGPFSDVINQSVSLNLTHSDTRKRGIGTPYEIQCSFTESYLLSQPACRPFSTFNKVDEPLLK
jgi:hypothetical protein